MPLIRGSVIGYDADRMVFNFAMLRPKGLSRAKSAASPWITWKEGAARPLRA
jgi:hypothetical protein